MLLIGSIKSSLAVLKESTSHVINCSLCTKCVSAGCHGKQVHSRPSIIVVIVCQLQTKCVTISCSSSGSEKSFLVPSSEQLAILLRPPLFSSPEREEVNNVGGWLCGREKGEAAKEARYGYRVHLYS